MPPIARRRARGRRWGVALAAAAALAAGAPAAQAQVRDMRGETAADRRPPKQPLLTAPLEIAANDGFNALLFAPPLEGAYTLPAGQANVFVRGHLSRTRVGDATDAYRFDATLRELRLTGALGLPDLGAPVELRVGLSFAALSGSERHVGAQFRGAEVVPLGWQEHGGARRATLGFKLRFYEAPEADLQLAISGWAKLAIDGDDHLTDSGGAEGGGVLHLSYALRLPKDRPGRPNLYMHLMAGGVARQRQDALAGRVTPNAGAVWGASVVLMLPRWPIAAAIQARGQVNGWQELGGFSSDPLSLQAGLRGWLAEGLVYEAGIGFGLADDVSAEWSLETAVGFRF